MTALFERVVVTSTQVEMMFAPVSRLTLANERGSGLPTIVAKATLSQFDQAVQRWRRRRRYRGSDGRSRPAWMFPMARGSKATHLHLYMEERKGLRLSTGFMSMADARRSFDALPAEEQRRHRLNAQVQRARAKTQSSRMDALLASASAPVHTDGPLGLATSEGFPMSRDALSASMGDRSLKKLSDEWSGRPQSFPVPAAPLPDFPETVEGHDPCVGACAQDLKDAEGRWKPEFADLSNYFRLAVKHASLEGRPFLVLKCASEASGHVKYILVTHSQHEKDCLFEAECVTMTKEASGLDEPQFTLRLAVRKVDGMNGVWWPDIMDETELVRSLLATSSTWSFSAATTQVLSLRQFRVSQLKEVPLESLLEKEEEMREAAAALRAFKVAVGVLKLARGKHGHKKRSARKVKAKGFAHVARGSQDPAVSVDGDPSEASASASGLASDAEEWWEDVIKAKKTKRRAHRQQNLQKDKKPSASGEVTGGGTQRTERPDVLASRSARRRLAAIFWRPLAMFASAKCIALVS